MRTLTKLPTKKLKGTIIHTDRRYREKLMELGVKESYSKNGKPWDDAGIELFHAVLKKELIYAGLQKSYKKMKVAIFEYIEVWYNMRRIQKRLGYLSSRDYLKKKL
ncbi:MAG: IS3 family transposase [Fusobacteriales bacterium]|nr:IS3 family transposase [Fusobacteriales bacterium]